MRKSADIKKRGPRTGVWIAALAAVFAASACGAYLLGQGGAGQVARIYQKGALVEEIALAAVTSPYEFTIRTNSGENTIRVKNGAIRVAEADCSDQTCVRQGWLSGGITPIVCLPHELVIRLEEPDRADEFDAVAR